MTSPMSEALPSFFQRLPVAFGSFVSILGNPSFAARVMALRQPASEASAAAAPAPAPEPLPTMREPAPEAALQLMGLLQREARLIDFVQEDLGQYSDADIGGVARVLHESCRRVLREHFSIAPVRPEAEGSRVTLPAGFDAGVVRLTGNVIGQPPFTGTLCHRGWRVTETRLPRLAERHDLTVLAQAEVEM